MSEQGHVAFTAKDKNGRAGVWVLQVGDETKRVVSEAVPALDWSLDGSTIFYAKKGAVYALTLPDGDPKRVSDREVHVFDNQGFKVVP